MKTELKIRDIVFVILVGGILIMFGLSALYEIISFHISGVAELEQYKVGHLTYYSISLGISTLMLSTILVFAYAYVKVKCLNMKTNKTDIDWYIPIAAAIVLGGFGLIGRHSMVETLLDSGFYECPKTMSHSRRPSTTYAINMQLCEK
ncbi:hypothetical protein [Thaumasiovibrio sp. DFM-14]|uniref:hypothetical protein n=1 Tax=Thaumasiovibrio sp. DFM-14 TaxID=3384792 RepID=UPI0039A3A8BA